MVLVLKPWRGQRDQLRPGILWQGQRFPKERQGEASGESSASVAIATPWLKESWTAAVAWHFMKSREVTEDVTCYSEDSSILEMQDHRMTTKDSVRYIVDLTWDRRQTAWTAYGGVKSWLSKPFAVQKIMSESQMLRGRTFTGLWFWFYLIITVSGSSFLLNYFIYFRFYRNPQLEILSF